eukprot:11157558-Lingulodinium_polyedra.AAC.1
MAGVAAWIAQHGAPRGFRPPALVGSMRTMAAAAYLEGLRLPDRALYDAIGVFFDRCIVPVWLARPVIE